MISVGVKRDSSNTLSKHPAEGLSKKINAAEHEHILDTLSVTETETLIKKKKKPNKTPHIYP